MQTHVNAIIDSNLDKLSTEKNPGIKQVRKLKMYRELERFLRSFFMINAIKFLVVAREKRRTV